MKKSLEGAVRWFLNHKLRLEKLEKDNRAMKMAIHQLIDDVSELALEVRRLKGGTK